MLIRLNVVNSQSTCIANHYIMHLKYIHFYLPIIPTSIKWGKNTQNTYRCISTQNNNGCYLNAEYYGNTIGIIIMK